MYVFIAMLLCIAVMTYSYVYRLRNLRPANLLRTQRINFSRREPDRSSVVPIPNRGEIPPCGELLVFQGGGEILVVLEI